MNNSYKANRKKFISAVFVLVIAGISTLVGLQIEFNINQSNRIQSTKMQNMLVSAISSSSLPVNIDAKTGDAYFSDVRLMIPNINDDVARMRYGLAQEDDQLLTLSPPLSTYLQKILNEDTTSKIFDQVPVAQACSRGFSIRSSQVQDSSQMKEVSMKTLGDGRTIYIYQEKECTILEDYIDVVKSIQSY